MKQIKDFLRLESTAGFVLIFATILALIFANSNMKPIYEAFLSTHFKVSFGSYILSKPLILWINDGLMAIFFLLIGLELKREFVCGHLSSRETIVLPLIGAIGGITFPAIIFYLFNHNDPVALTGWAIPAATDIAFALGVLALLSDRIPKSAKIFLLTLAIFDDLAAIVIIALFYTADISSEALLLSIIGILVLTCLRLAKIKSLTPYALAGIFLWVCVLKSGVHATLAGVITAFFIMIDDKNPNNSPLHYLEEKLHPWVAYMILPVFALANAGLDFSGIDMSMMLNPITLGICVGLIAGNQVGIFSLCYIAVKFFGIKLPSQINFLGLYGLSILAGIGFTMSLFITSLAYGEQGHAELVDFARLGILVGSFIAAVYGYFLLRYAYAAKAKK